MRFDIKPYIGAEIINFEMPRIKIRSILGSVSAWEEFYRTDQSKTPADIFKEVGLIVNYNSKDLCDAIEFFGVAQVFFNGIALLDMSYRSIYLYFVTNDSKLEEDASGFISFKCGTGIYAPNKIDDPLEKIESVIVFKKDYYS